MPAVRILSRFRFLGHAFVAVSALALGGWKVASVEDPAAKMKTATVALLDSLSDEQRQAATYEFGSDERTTWNFVPLDSRKGLQLREMDEKQRKLAFDLLESSLSGVGHTKAVQIMKLEGLLDQLQESEKPVRDPLRYYVSVYGDPQSDGKWGMSFEGHHLSLNFVIEDGKLSSTTPTFYAANPAVIPDDLPKDVESPLPPNAKPLGPEENYAFALRQSLTEEQAKTATIAAECPREIRGPNDPQPSREAPQGIAAGDLEASQAKMLKQLVEAYAMNVPQPVAEARMQAIDEAGWKNVRFGWAGATQAGEPHYYRVQGPTFLIEFVNSQPDGAGNPANHIHAVWRDMQGDFGLKLATAKSGG